MGIDSIYRFLESLGYTHPIHPILVHLTIGLVIAALIFSLLSRIPRYSRFAVTAQHCATLAFFSVFPTVLLGVMDWFHYYGGSLIYPIKMKIFLASGLGMLLLLAVLLHVKFTSRSRVIITIYLFALSAVTGLGYFGGELVFASHAPQEPVAEKSTAASGETGPILYSDLEGILQSRCVQCHNEDNPLRGLDLSSYEGTMAGSENGPIIIPGDPAKSALIQRINGTTQPRMPLVGPGLTEAQIRSFEAWIEAGAPEGNSDNRLAAPQQPPGESGA
ncbi:c-type cytochrome domain-containing protein [Ectothiorhodospira mobilis]|uniref:c-type cytochrome domain-containing protein n=1 Tax=Ectothiorhodospira mobilis TaxID=195064 RepID=UPI001902D986|nr:c-type cytochrome domain-containing protein [Ectothiorhodospira mobilis]MBK1692185.1 hypothetical protein [Ectothiorhodospira mobilis]